MHPIRILSNVNYRLNEYSSSLWYKPFKIVSERIIPYRVYRTESTFNENFMLLLRSLAHALTAKYHVTALTSMTYYYLND